MARPCKYEQKVKPYLSEIAEMALTMTEEEIAEALGISYATFQRYKTHYEELRDALKSGRRVLVWEVKDNLIKKAKGYYYEETKTVRERDDTGELIVTRIETNRKWAPPDVAAANLLLKNYDRDNWANDPQALELRKRELELQEKKIEEQSW